jgi:Flp pilus assembly protein TadD
VQVVKAGQRALSIAYTLDPTSVPIYWYIGNARVLLKDDAQAKTDFIQAYYYNPYNRNVLNDLASSYAKNNQLTLAKTYYLEASRISPRFDEPKLNLAAIYIGQKQYGLAAHCLKSLYHDSERRTNYQKIVDAFQ